MVIDDVIIKIAKRFVTKYEIIPPFNLLQIVEDFAQVKFLDIPVDGVDGITLNLKSPGKKTKVIIQNKAPETRKRFTLAHELGHIIIPWHFGTIIDETHPEEYRDSVYGQMESEANRFAAEVLMPTFWVLEQFEKNSDLAICHEKIVEKAKVSPISAAIRMKELAIINIVYVEVTSSRVSNIGKSVGTISDTQTLGEIFNPDFYKYVEAQSIYEYGSKTYYWYKLNDHIKIEKYIGSDSAQDILREILNDVCHPLEVETKYKSIMSISGYANGHLKKKGNLTFDNLITECIKRIRREEYLAITDHPRFNDFINKRCEGFLKN